jgi:uncharacterized protein
VFVPFEGGQPSGAAEDFLTGFIADPERVPWVDRPPHEIVREQVRLTIQPFDAPTHAGVISRIVEHLRADDMLLFATDYPHWQFEGDDVLPVGLPADLIEKMAVANPLAIYPRLRETA